MPRGISYRFAFCLVARPPGPPCPPIILIGRAMKKNLEPSSEQAIRLFPLLRSFRLKGSEHAAHRWCSEPDPCLLFERPPNYIPGNQKQNLKGGFMSDPRPAEAPATLNIYQRMLKVQLAAKSVRKTDTVQVSGERSYKAVTHDEVAALLHDPLAQAGIVLLPAVTKYSITEFEVEKKSNYGGGNYKQKWYRTDIEILVKWINADDPKDFFESNGAAFALDTSDKSFAKAYSLALKIVLLKVHLLESRDGEEARIFENEQSAGGKNLPPAQPKNSAPAAQGKKSTPPPPAGKKPANLAPANDDDIATMYSLATERGVDAAEVNYLIKNGYGIAEPGKLPVFVCREILHLLNKEDTNSATIMAESQRVISRREAARIKAESEKSGGQR